HLALRSSCGLAAAGFNLLFNALTLSLSFSIGSISFSSLWIPCSVWGHRSGSLSFLGRTRAAHVRLAHQTCQEVAVLPSVQRGRNYILLSGEQWSISFRAPFL